MSFSQQQVRKLRASVRAAHVKAREIEGKTLHYLEGWHVVSEANRIFGFDAWDRETVSSECVWRTQVEGQFAAAYLTRVRIRVRAGEGIVIREGLGSGEAMACSPGQAHERASKAAETDATKRALSTFGNSFGLSLYRDKSEPPRPARVAPQPGGTPAQRAVREVAKAMRTAERVSLIPDADEVNDAVDAKHEAAAPPAQSRAPLSPEAAETSELAAEDAPLIEPVLVSDNRSPFTCEPILPPGEGLSPSSAVADKSMGSSQSNAAPTSALSASVSRVALLPVHLPPDFGGAGRIDKSVLTLSEPKRRRDREHLRFVARQPCLVCGRTPSQAHHLRIAQPRALGRKVSDEFTVPLCALHHHDLHRKGNEAEWWWGHTIEPLPIAERLWAQNRMGFNIDDTSLVEPGR